LPGIIALLHGNTIPQSRLEHYHWLEELLHAGTGTTERGELIAVGGRVLSVVALGATLEAARERAYEAVVHLATAPKSNRSYTAIDAALADVRAGKAGPVPEALRDSHYASAADLGHGAGYRYAHDYEAGVAPMEFMPEGLEGARYYEPTTRGFESQITQRLARIREILDGDT
ncbi:MAG: phosphoribosylglycinamide synthetase C domain-containing protein, partial [Peptidiphaga sp.]